MLAGIYSSIQFMAHREAQFGDPQLAIGLKATSWAAKAMPSCYP